MKKHATLLGAVLLGLVSVLSYAQTPVPFLNQPLIPDATAPGGPQFVLTINGTGFVSKSVVNWNGNALATQFVSGSKLTAIVPAANIATANTASVTVVNPLPGGGTSDVVFFPIGPDTGNYVGFGLVSSPATGDHPTSVVVGDFNGDGKLDLALGSEHAGRVFVFLGDGAGNFKLASSPYFGGGPLAVGDFNGDGKLDLAVVNGSTVSILLGDGTGHFNLASAPQAGSGSDAVAVGDFNGDGKLDLAVVNSGGGSVSILLGDGAGNFTLASSPAAGSTPYSIAVGDFNGDGKLDLAVANLEDDTLSILLGDGTGQFTLASSPATGRGPYSVAVGDFNGDGKLDLAVADTGWSRGGLSILLGDGTGNFILTSSSSLNPAPTSVAVGDFNGDGKLDLAVANGDASILLGNGTGKFTLVSSTFGGIYNESLAVGDFNGDGKLDFAFVNHWGDGAPVLLAAVPPVVLSPTNLNFGAQVVGTSSSPQPVTLTNIGSASINIGRIAINTVDYSETNNCPSKVLPNGQCTINVIFSPRKVNTLVGTLRIKDNAVTSPQTVPLTGVGSLVTLLPSSLRFAGGQRVGTHSKPQLVTFTNYGTRAVIIHSIHFVGRGRADYAQTNNCGTAVPAGGECTISVTFAPTSKGPKLATLNVSDNGGGSPQTVALSGFGE